MTRSNQAELFYFKDDGAIPNNALPLLVYKGGFTPSALASQMIERCDANRWTNLWHNGIYSFHHYHSTSHEVLGIYADSALLHLGGEQGKKIQVEAGDVIIIPAGVGHKNLR